MRRPSRQSYILHLTTQLVTGPQDKRPSYKRRAFGRDAGLDPSQALVEPSHHRPCIVASCVARWGWKPVDLIVLAKRHSAPDIDRPSRKHFCDRSSCMSSVDGATSLLTQSWHRPCNECGSKLVREQPTYHPSRFSLLPHPPSSPPSPEAGSQGKQGWGRTLSVRVGLG